MAAGWAVIAGGGGSAAWLCWLGRARVVPTAAAKKQTVSHDLDCSFPGLVVVVIVVQVNRHFYSIKSCNVMDKNYF